MDRSSNRIEPAGRNLVAVVVFIGKRGAMHHATNNRRGLRVIDSRKPGEISAEDLRKNVDLAMYTAKEQGKNTYALFEPSMREGFDRAREILEAASPDVLITFADDHFDQLHAADRDAFLRCVKARAVPVWRRRA